MSIQETPEKEHHPQNGRNPFVIIGGFVLLGLAVALLIFGRGLFGSEATQTEDTAVLEQVPAFEEADSAMVQLPTGGGPLNVGDMAYNFTLQDLDGNTISLEDFHGRPVIINFWATWCAPCRVEMPELQAAYEAYQEDGLVILALDQQDPPDLVEEFFYDEMGLTFTPVLDSEGAVSELYGANRIFPTSFFINPEGEITAVHRGPMVQSQIDGYLAETVSRN